MHYYVDGYNLIFRRLKLGSDLKAKRDKIVEDLSLKASILKLSASLVFDSQYLNQESTRHHVKDLEVLYTSIGETADDFILNEIKSSLNPRKITVVTSDKWLAQRARHLHAHAESIEEFFDLLERRWQNQKKIAIKPKTPTAPPSKQAFDLPKLLPKNEGPVKTKAHIQTSEELFTHYLSEFEKLSVEEDAGQKKSKKAKRAPPIKKEPVIEDEMERWLRLFESNTKEI